MTNWPENDRNEESKWNTMESELAHYKEYHKFYFISILFLLFSGFIFVEFLIWLSHFIFNFFLASLLSSSESEKRKKNWWFHSKQICCVSFFLDFRTNSHDDGVREREGERMGRMLLESDPQFEFASHSTAIYASICKFYVLLICRFFVKDSERGPDRPPREGS